MSLSNTFWHFRVQMHTFFAESYELESTNVDIRSGSPCTHENCASSFINCANLHFQATATMGSILLFQRPMLVQEARVLPFCNLNSCYSLSLIQLIIHFSLNQVRHALHGRIMLLLLLYWCFCKPSSSSLCIHPVHRIRVCIPCVNCNVYLPIW